MVLRKNKGSVLPRPSGQPQNTMLYGPNAADCDVLVGTYDGITGDLVTVLEGIAQVIGEQASLEYRKGAELIHENRNPRDWSSFEAKAADMCVAVMGGHPMLEGEGGEAILSDNIGDRHGIGIPDPQIEFIKKISAHDTPVILVIAGGSAMAFEEVFDMVEAVVWMNYPGEQGGRAVADIIFGNANPSGRLPMTWPKSLDQLPPYEDYAIATKGRTYRYMEDDPMLPFGFGLSYTTFGYGKAQLSSDSITSGEAVTVSVTVTNTGDTTGDEVVQLYVTDDEASTNTPLAALKAVQKVSLDPGASADVAFEVTPDMMELVTDDGSRVIEPGHFTLTVGGCSPRARGQALGAPAPTTASFAVS